jgi:hypothetical protein
MPDDPLDTNPAPPPPPPPPRRLVCEYCECQLSPKGEVMAMGAKAKEFRKHEEIVEGKDKEIARLQNEITALKAERDELKRQASGGGNTGRVRQVGGLVYKR